jgi:hypothetical protein
LSSRETVTSRFRSSSILVGWWSEQYNNFTKLLIAAGTARQHHQQREGSLFRLGRLLRVCGGLSHSSRTMMRAAVQSQRGDDVGSSSPRGGAPWNSRRASPRRQHTRAGRKDQANYCYGDRKFINSKWKFNNTLTLHPKQKICRSDFCSFFKPIRTRRYARDRNVLAPSTKQSTQPRFGPNNILFDFFILACL